MKLLLKLLVGLLPLAATGRDFAILRSDKRLAISETEQVDFRAGDCFPILETNDTGSMLSLDCGIRSLRWTVVWQDVQRVPESAERWKKFEDRLNQVYAPIAAKRLMPITAADVKGLWEVQFKK